MRREDLVTLVECAAIVVILGWVGYLLVDALILSPPNL